MFLLRLPIVAALVIFTFRLGPDMSRAIAGFAPGIHAGAVKCRNAHYAGFRNQCGLDRFFPEVGLGVIAIGGQPPFSCAAGPWKIQIPADLGVVLLYARPFPWREMKRRCG